MQRKSLKSWKQMMNGRKPSPPNSFACCGSTALNGRELVHSIRSIPRALMSVRLAICLCLLLIRNLIAVQVGRAISIRFLARSKHPPIEHYLWPEWKSIVVAVADIWAMYLMMGRLRLANAIVWMGCRLNLCQADASHSLFFSALSLCYSGADGTGICWD